MSDWHRTEAFERLALLTTRFRFLEGPDWDQGRQALRAEMEPYIEELGFDTANDEHCARFNAAFAARQDALRWMPYDDYLHTEHWQTVRAGALARARGACLVCSEPRSLHVHHRSYADRGNEGPEDVQVLCAGCHHLFHANRDLARV